MSWTAIVPIKPPSNRKSRLVSMEANARVRLSEAMLHHVLVTLEMHAQVAKVFVLAQSPYSGLGWIADKGRGLNAELEAARESLAEEDVLVVHADLPLLNAEDLSSIFAVADRHSVAIAPDRHGTGTNALALKARFPFMFQFGPDSRRLHEAALPCGAAIHRPGLALDIDTADDLALIRLLEGR